MRQCFKAPGASSLVRLPQRIGREEEESGDASQAGDGSDGDHPVLPGQQQRQGAARQAAHELIDQPLDGKVHASAVFAGLSGFDGGDLGREGVGDGKEHTDGKAADHAVDDAQCHRRHGQPQASPGERVEQHHARKDHERQPKAPLGALPAVEQVEEDQRERHRRKHSRVHHPQLRVAQAHHIGGHEGDPAQEKLQSEEEGGHRKHIDAKGPVAERHLDALPQRHV